MNDSAEQEKFIVPEEVKIDHMTLVDFREANAQAQHDEDHIANSKYSDVLLIVTGGTLCMVQTKDGYQPAKNLAQRLKAYKTFYDAEECKKLGVDEETLVTPPTAYHNRIRFKVFEFDNLIDSSNIEIDD